MFTLESTELEMQNEKRLAGQGEEKHGGEAGEGLCLLCELVFLHSAHQFPNLSDKRELSVHDHSQIGSISRHE